MSLNVRLFRSLLLFATATLPATGFARQYIGHANSVNLNVLGTVGIYSGTGELPASGGSLSSSLASLSVSGGVGGKTTLITTDLLTASTVGGSGSVTSSAAVNNALVFPDATNLLSASTITSTAFASGGVRTGSSTITNLFVLGSSVTVTGAVNQVYSVPGILDLTINEQFLNGDGSITVRALDLNILDPARAGRVILAESTAGTAPEPTVLSLFLIGALALRVRYGPDKRRQLVNRP